MITLSEPLLERVRGIGTVLGISDSACVEYLVDTFLDAFGGDGDTLRLVGLAEDFEYSTREEAAGVAERLEAFAAENHLAGGAHYEPLISVEVIGSDEAGWELETERLAGDHWRPVMEDWPPPDWPLEQGEDWKD